MAGHIQDRWFKTETDADGKTVRIKTERHSTGMRYRARYVGPDGAEKSKSFADGQKRRAETWLSGIETDMTRGQYTDPKSVRITFRQYAEKWLDSKTPSPMTRKELGRRLRLHVYPVLGSRPIGTFRPEHIRELLAALELGGTHVADRGVGSRLAAGGRDQERQNPDGSLHLSISGATTSREAMSATRSAIMRPRDLWRIRPIALNEPVRKRAR